jgi:hypothetical protein
MATWIDIANIIASSSVKTQFTLTEIPFLRLGKPSNNEQTKKI